MVKRIKWEKLAVENKKCAVLAIFYCGLQSVKSFHISPLDRRDCKDRHNFGICKTKATASGGGFCTIYNRYYFPSIFFTSAATKNRCRRRSINDSYFPSIFFTSAATKNRCRRRSINDSYFPSIFFTSAATKNRCRRRSVNNSYFPSIFFTSAATVAPL